MVKTYLDCPERFRLERIKGVLPSHRSCEVVFGTALHGALALYHQQLAANVSLSCDEVVREFEELFGVAQQGPIPVQWTDADAKERMLDQARDLTSLYMVQRTARRVLAVEAPFKIDPERLPRSFAFHEPLAGIVDLVEEEADGTIYITELKTSSKRFDQARVSFDLQMSIYGAAREALGFPTAKLRFCVLVRGRKPAIETYEVVRESAKIDEAGRVVSEVLRAVDARIFYPVRSWRCSTCPVRSHCGSR
jgi:putative RecB family exonuclease